IDASERHERAQLNRFASWLLLGIAAILAVLGSHRGIVAAIGLSGLIVLAGHLLRGWLRASLHVAFAMFAACIAWPHAAAFATLVVATGVVAWSRLVLRRHALGEVGAGAGWGAVCGRAFRWGIAAQGRASAPRPSANAHQRQDDGRTDAPGHHPQRGAAKHR